MSKGESCPFCDILRRHSMTKILFEVVIVMCISYCVDFVRRLTKLQYFEIGGHVEKSICK